MIWVGAALVGCQSTVGSNEAETTTTTTPATTTSTATVTTTQISTSTSTTINFGITYSISGKVFFANTTDGIKGGANVQASGPVTGNAATDPATGDYTITGLPAGSYILTGDKTGWSISNTSANITSSDLTGKNLMAVPEHWNIVNLPGGGHSLKFAKEFLNSTITPARALLYAVGSLLKSTNGGGNWTDISLNTPTSDALVNCGDFGPGTSFLVSKKGWVYVSTNEGADGFMANTFEVGGKLPFPYLPIQVTTTEIKAIDLKTGLAITPDGKLVNVHLSFIPGSTYSEIMTDNVYNSFQNDLVLAAGEPDQCYVVGNHGVIKTNLGSAWEIFNANNDPATFESMDLTGIDGQPDSGFFIVTASGGANNSGAIFTTDDAGNTWTKELSGVPYPLNYPRLMTDNEFMFGGNGLILRRIK